MGEPLRVLFLEDDDDAVFLVERAVARLNRSLQLQHCHHGVEAISRLEASPDHELPHFILSDLKMPNMDGIQFTAWLRHSRFSCLPLVIFTSSARGDDVARAYGAGANSVITKPLDTVSLERVLGTIFHYWDDVCRVKEHSRMVHGQCIRPCRKQ